MSKTYTEMMSQPAALRQTYDLILSRRAELTAFLADYKPRGFITIGCGSGYCLSQSAALSLAQNTGLPARAFPAGDLMLHAQEYAALLNHCILLAPTRSGSTSELLMAIDAIRAVADVKVLTISAVTHSAASQKADFCLDIPWSFDASVCQTRTVSSLYCANLLLSAIWGGQDGLVARMETMLAGLEAFMAASAPALSAIAKGPWDNAVILADGEMAGLASEGSMAFTEIAQLHAHHYHILDVRHGPMVLVTEKTLVICALRPEGLSQQLRLIADCKQRGATVVAVVDESTAVADADLVLAFGQALPNALAGIPMITVVQQIAVAKAIDLHLDADNPNGLVSFVQL